MYTTSIAKELHRRVWTILALFLAAAALIAGMAVFLPPGVDWNNAFKPAALLLLEGKSPYQNNFFLNAPWALLPMIPLALLQDAVGRALLEFANLCAIAYTAYRLGAKPATIGVLLLSPPVLHCVLNGNIDGLVTLGFVLPPQIGLFFLFAKPQLGIAVVVFWLVEAWRTGGWKQALRVFAPASLALLLSFAIFGFWPLLARQDLGLWWNASLWPMSIPVGLALLVAAIRKRDLRYAMGASPCLTPYLLLHSWVVALLAVASSLPEMTAAVAGLWILIFIGAFGGG